MRLWRCVDFAVVVQSCHFILHLEAKDFVLATLMPSPSGTRLKFTAKHRCAHHLWCSSSLVMETSTLESLLLENGVSVDVLHALNAPPFKVSSIKQFANYFESKAEVNSIFLQTTKFKDEGDTVANLKQAWREAESMTSRGLKRAAEGLPDEGLDDPLRDPVETTLKSNFEAYYGYNIPSTWMGVPSLVGRIYRELSKRTNHMAPKLDKVRTVSQSVDLGPMVKKHRLAAGLEITTGGQQTGENIGGSFQYLYKLQTLMYTMAYAGAFKVQENGADMVMIPLQRCIDHLANAQNFVMSNASKISDYANLTALAKRDETIRVKWAEIFRSSNHSYGQVMADTEAFATTVWIAEQQAEPNNRGRGQQQQQQQQPQNQGSQKGGNGPRKGQPQMQSGGSQSFASKLPFRSSAVERYGSKFKTAKVDSNKKPFCKPWNDNRGGVGCTVSQCNNKHACDAMLPSGQPCDDRRHKRANHTGPTVPLE